MYLNVNGAISCLMIFSFLHVFNFFIIIAWGLKWSPFNKHIKTALVVIGEFL